MGKTIKLVSSGSRKGSSEYYSQEVKKKQAQKTSHAVGEITRSVAARSEASEEDNTGVCKECGAIYADDSEELKKKWKGCDNCPRWYRYVCIGLISIPTGFWSCDLCS